MAKTTESLPGTKLITTDVSTYATYARATAVPTAPGEANPSPRFDTRVTRVEIRPLSSNTGTISFGVGSGAPASPNIITLDKTDFPVILEPPNGGFFNLANLWFASSAASQGVQIIYWNHNG